MAVLEGRAGHRRTGRATLAMVAESAGVSVATVSKVVNGRDDVAATTRAHIEEMLRSHGYMPRSARRAMVPLPGVELLIGGRFDAYATRLIEGVVHAAAQSRVRVVVGAAAEACVEAGSPRCLAGRTAAATRAGAVLAAGALDEPCIDALAKAGLPLVVIDSIKLPRSTITSVGSTNFAGGVTITQHLLDLGHERISYIGGPASSASNQARLHGYRAALESAGIGLQPERAFNERFSYEVGLRAGGELLDLPTRPTAVVGASDAVALGVMEAARERGLRIPEKLSVTGFDDTELATTASPPLTVIRQPLREMGRVALTTVLRIASGEELGSHHIELATELVIRDTTAPPSR